MVQHKHFLLLCGILHVSVTETRELILKKMKTNSDFLTEQSVHRLLNLASIKKLIVLCNHAKDCTATNMT